LSLLISLIFESSTQWKETNSTQTIIYSEMIYKNFPLRIHTKRL